MDAAAIMAGLGLGDGKIEVAGVPNATEPTAAQPKVLAQLRKPQAKSDPLSAFGSGGKMPAASASKLGAIAQGIDHGLQGVQEGRAAAEKSRAEALKSRIDMAKMLFEQDMKIRANAREDKKAAFEQGPKFETATRQADERNKSLSKMWEGKGAKDKKEAVDPLKVEERLQKYLGNHPASKALSADDEAPAYQKMKPERRAQLEATLKAEETRVRTLAKGAGAAASPEPEEASETSAETPSTNVAATPPARPRDTVDPKLRLGQAGAALESGADPAAVMKMLSDMGVEAPAGFFDTFAQPQPQQPELEQPQTPLFDG